MRTISLQTLVLLVWILDCVPANCCKKKEKKATFTLHLHCLLSESVSHILAPKLKLCAKHSTPICYRHQLFLCAVLDGTEE